MLQCMGLQSRTWLSRWTTTTQRRYRNRMICLIWQLRGKWQETLEKQSPSTRGILVPLPRIKPEPPALEVQSLNHWTTREVFIFHSEKLVMNHINYRGNQKHELEIPFGGGKGGRWMDGRLTFHFILSGRTYIFVMNMQYFYNLNKYFNKNWILF